ncbi:hypothetical protein ACIA5C_34940 [Actinoplanes sp. NPDC051343]|uniref:hypothetical protein n=1 Tax=Actinoplanes sp. NPDC051343 TaxID=3363906 RepID=UPI003794B4C5
MGRATEYSVVLDVEDWLMIDATLDDELDRLSQEGWDQDDWGEPSRDPHWAELSELGLSVRQAGWAQVPEQQRNQRRTAGRAETLTPTARQWGLVVFALESRGSHQIPAGVRPEYVEMLKTTAARRRRIAALLRRQLAVGGLSQVPVVDTRGR